jgi:hypothetical protein
MALVYRHTGLDNNEVFYIGIGNKKSRAYTKTRGRSVFWKSYAAKHGVEVEILTESVDYETAKELEVSLIAWYGRRNTGLGPLVNLTDGGEGCLGMVHTDVHKQNMRKLHTGNKYNLGKHHSDGTKRRIAETRKERGHTSWTLGKKLPEETKEKIRQSVTGIKHTDETKAKMSAIRLGKTLVRVEKTCPHCNKVGKGPNMARYHFDNCKNK